VSRVRVLALALGALLVAAIVALVVARGGAGKDQSAAVAPTARVTTAPIVSRTLKNVSEAYGVVQADPAGTITLAAPRAVIVTAVLVQLGQPVRAGQALVVVASAPAADLAYRQAVAAATSAAKDLARVQRLFDEHLAASDQLIVARKAVADAQAALAAQQSQGAGRGSQTLTAPAAAVVTALAAAPGDRLAQDAPMVVMARQGAVLARLGLEPGTGDFAVGQPVTIRPAGGGASIASRLVMVGRAADPTTRTIDALAPLGAAAPPIGSGVEADVLTGTHVGLTAPRAAVVFDETGDHVFIVSGGKAQRVFVTVGRDHGDDIEVKGPIAAGDLVAVEGAQELQDGMAVRVAAR